MASPDRHFANAAIFTHSTGLTPNSGDAALYIKSDNKAYIKDSGGTETAVGGGGSKTLARFTAMDNQPTAVTFATLDTRNSIAVLDFDDTTNEFAVFLDGVPEGADLSSGIVVRLKWAATTATSGAVRWGAEIMNLDTDIDSDSFDTATEANGTTAATSGIPNLTAITCTTIDSIVAGDFFRLRVYRDSADTGNDTMTGDAELIAVEVRSAA